MNKNKSILTFFTLLVFLISGAFLRINRMNKELEVINGFEFFVNMASNFRANPGNYDFEESLKMKNDPENYIFTRKPAKKAVASFENEKGWAFFMSCVIPEGTKGIRNIAWIMAKWQLVLDLFVIVLLFYSGRAIAGPIGACLAAGFYAFSPFVMRMVVWVCYYYWAIPLSALSILFWTCVYSPEERRRSFRIETVKFFAYGLAMGFAAFIRLGFLYLPLFMTPIVFLRERSVKRASMLVIVMLFGQALLLTPQVILTHKFYKKWDITTRGLWHFVIQGLGAHPNPWKIKDVSDVNAFQWAIDQGGPDVNKVGITEFDKFMEKKAISFLKERPDIFLSNTFLNIREGMVLKNHFPEKKLSAFHILFPWLLALILVICYFVQKNAFLTLVSVIFQGLYCLFIPLIYFPSTLTYITAYVPIYTLLVALIPAFTVLLFFSLTRKFFRQFRTTHAL